MELNSAPDARGIKSPAEDLDAGSNGSGAVSAGLLCSVSSLAQRAIAILLLPFFIRWLTPAQYGQIGILAALSSLALYVFPLGLEAIVMRGWFATTGAKADRLRFANDVQRILLLAPFVLIGPFVVALSIIGTFRVVQIEYVILTLLAGAIYVAATVVPYGVLRAERRAFIYIRLGIFYVAIQILARLLLVGTLHWGVIGWVASDLIAATSLLIAPGAAKIRVFPGVPNRVGWAALRSGLPLVPHGLGQWALAVSDRLILARNVPLAAIAVYSVGYQVGTILLLCFTEFNRALSPDYAALAASDTDSTRIQRLVAGQSGTVLTIGAGAVVAVPPAIRLLLPASYVGSTAVVPWVVLGSVFVGLYQISMNHITLVRGDTSRIWFATALSTIVNIVLNLLTVRKFGIQAAAVNTAAAYGVLLILVRAYEVRTASCALVPNWALFRWYLLLVLGTFGFGCIVNIASSARMLTFTVDAGIAVVAVGVAVAMFWKAERNSPYGAASS